MGRGEGKIPEKLGAEGFLCYSQDPSGHASLLHSNYKAAAVGMLKLMG